MVIAVDFDNTLFFTVYPKIINPRKAVIDCMKELRARGHKIVLNTCRRDEYLEEAVNACREQGLEFDAVNENVPERVERFGGDCRKVSADLYVEDRAVSPDELLLCMRLTEKKEEKDDI